MAQTQKKKSSAKKGEPMDAIDLLTADHSELEQLFQRFDGMRTGDLGKKRALVEKISRGLSMHAAIEEEILYPALRQTVPTLDHDVADALDDHRTVKEALSRIETMDPATQEFDDEVSTMIEEVRTHVEEEEGELFPAMRKQFSTERLRELGVQLAAAKRLAPTEPRPNTPQTPPLNVPINLAGGIMDRAVQMAPGAVVRVVDLTRNVIRWEMRMVKRVLRIGR